MHPQVCTMKERTRTERDTERIEPMKLFHTATDVDCPTCGTLEGKHCSYRGGLVSDHSERVRAGARLTIAALDAQNL